MKKKIKLRDLTPEQFENLRKSECGRYLRCDSCILGNVKCVSLDSGWVYHKDLYSDKFLDQEVEIEVEPIFTDKEREYLHNLLKPFKDRIEEIKLVKLGTYENDTITYLRITIKSILSLEQLESIYLPYFKFGTMYKGLELGKPYKGGELKELLKELELL